MYDEEKFWWSGVCLCAAMFTMRGLIFREGREVDDGVGVEWLPRRIFPRIR